MNKIAKLKLTTEPALKQLTNIKDQKNIHPHYLQQSSNQENIKSYHNPSNLSTSIEDKNECVEININWNLIRGILCAGLFPHVIRLGE